MLASKGYDLNVGFVTNMHLSLGLLQNMIQNVGELLSIGYFRHFQLSVEGTV